MDELESQVAKIQIGNFRHTSSYVLVTAERASASSAELYVVAELPLLNPAALESVENICLSIAASLKRAYKRPPTAATFEAAVAEINDELAKLAGLGQTAWVDKLNCVVAVKEDGIFHISTTGKVVAYLFRGGDFTDISCSSDKPHVLKTFENLASGKIRLGDLLILSTPQLFNYIAVDRLKNILQSNNFLLASQTIIEILKENAGPEVAFGTVFNLQVEPGQAGNEEVDLEEYEAKHEPTGSFFERTKAFLASFAMLDKLKRKPHVGLPKISLPQRIKNISGSTRHLMSKGPALWGALGKGVSASRQLLSVTNFKSLSRQKKFFLISVVVLVFALGINLTISAKLRRGKQAETEVGTRLQEITELLSKMQTSLLYKDDANARQYMFDAAAKLPEEASVPSGLKDEYASAKQQLEEAKQKVEKIRQVQTTVVGNLAAGSGLIKLPDALGVQAGTAIVSYNKQSGLIQDGQLHISESISQSVYTSGNKAVIYSENGLQIWDYEAGSLGETFTQNVPAAEDLVGLAFYSTNSRVYTINKKTGQILNFLVGENSISRPILWMQSMDLTSSLDLAIDGSVYVLNPSGVTKYQSGKLAEFNQAPLLQPFSGSGKIYTERDFENIYILDIGNNRVVVMDKQGNLVATLTSPEFKDLKDFAVDEKTSTIYLLSGSTLLRATY